MILLGEHFVNTCACCAALCRFSLALRSPLPTCTVTVRELGEEGKSKTKLGPEILNVLDCSAIK